MSFIARVSSLDIPIEYSDGIDFQPLMCNKEKRLTGYEYLWVVTFEILLQSRPLCSLGYSEQG